MEISTTLASAVGTETLGVGEGEGRGEGRGRREREDQERLQELWSLNPASEVRELWVCGQVASLLEPQSPVL